jgi:hypothetical protein
MADWGQTSSQAPHPTQSSTFTLATKPNTSNNLGPFNQKVVFIGFLRTIIQAVPDILRFVRISIQNHHPKKYLFRRT